MLSHRKPAFWALAVMLAAVILAAVWLVTKPAQSLELPEAASVLSVSLEQFSQRESSGAVAVANREDIATLLSVLAGAKKTLLASVHDYPTQSDYLLVRISLATETRTLCLYEEGNEYYIEEPYLGVYRSSENASVAIHGIHAQGVQEVRLVAEGSIPQAVREYAVDYVQSDIAYYNSMEDQTIADAKITALTRLNTGTATETMDIQMWLLEYRLLPQDADKVFLAGGMSMEDGWRTEQGSTGRPLLVLVHDYAADTWQRVGTTHTLGVLEDHQGDYSAATMALYQLYRATASAIVEWEFILARSSVFPALPIRFQVPADSVRVSVDGGRFYRRDATRTPNYIDCGQEMTYQQSETALWSPLEEDDAGNMGVSTGCTLSFELLAANRVVSSGSISIRQSDGVPESGIRTYALKMVESDSDFRLIPGDGHDGGVIMTDEQ